MAGEDGERDRAGDGGEDGRGAGPEAVARGGAPLPPPCGPTATTTTLALDRADLTAAVDRAAATGERVLLTRDGQPLAAIVPAADTAWLEALGDELDAETLRRARDEWERGGRRTVPLDGLARELGLDA